MKYSMLQYRATFSFLRDAAGRGTVVKGNFCVPMIVLTDLCKLYLEPVGLRIKENKRGKVSTVSIERNNYDED